MTSDSTYAGPYGRGAAIYRNAGWHGALPIGRAPGRKYPPPNGYTGHGAPYPSGPDVQAWVDGPEAGFNIGLRAPEGVIGLDVDHYKGKSGGDTLADLESRFGPLPPTWVSSARPAPSGIRWYRVPTHLDGREVNWPGEAGKFIEIIQTGHRYAVVWPSTNPEADGAEYRWRRDNREGDSGGILPHPGELPWLPEAWVRGLMLGHDRTEKADLAGGALAQWWSELRGGVPCPVVATVRDRALRGLQDVDGARHEMTRDAAAALTRLGGEGHRGAGRALEDLADAFGAAVGPERLAGGEWSRLLSGAVKLAAADNPVPRQSCEHDTLTPYAGPPGFDLASFTPPEVATALTGATPGNLTLPDEFWSARDSLARIRQAAHSKVRSGDVVFYGTLARIAAMAPHTLRAETGVGTAASLNLFAAIVGPSGGGKSSGISVGRELVKETRPIDEYPLGSGEGVAEAYMGEAMEPTGDMDKNGAAKMVKVRKMVRHNVLFHSDEGNALNKLIERAGSTVGETLRSAWSGETIGQKNGRVETTRTVPARSYAAGLVIGYQPKTVLPLLADVEAGTPQRFLFCWSVDTSIPPRSARVLWPGEMLSPFPPEVATDQPALGSIISAPRPAMLGETVTFAEAILDELYETEHAKNTGSLPADHPLRDPFRSQHPVLKVKISALLALLEGRRNVTVDDWRLAQIVIDTSDRVRIHLQALGAACAREEAEQADRVHARRALMAHVAVDQHATEQASTAVLRLAAAISRKVHAAGEAGLMRSAARKTVASSSRRLFGDAVHESTATGWLIEDGARLLPGPSVPAV